MAITDEISRLNIAKSNIRNELAKLDVNIPTDGKLDSYYAYIRDYVSKFNERLEMLESNAEKSLYFGGSAVETNTDTIENKLSFFEKTEKNTIYLKE